ncbi:hypothetical protein DV736_g2488, partial [Chaetothyriales sp. CBS 134916]
MDFNTDFLSFEVDPNQPTPFDSIPGLFDFNDPVFFSEDPAITDQSLIELFDIDHLETPKQASVPTTRPSEDCMVQQDLLERVQQLEKQSQQFEKQSQEFEKKSQEFEKQSQQLEEQYAAFPVFEP